MTTKKANILGIPLDVCSQDEVLLTINHFIESGIPHQITTVNAEFIMTAQKSSAFRQVLMESDLSLADGSGVISAAKTLGQPTPVYWPGVELVQAMARLAAEEGYKIFMLGGREGSGKKAAQTLLSLHPALKIVGQEEGSPEDDRLIEEIKAGRPDILLVAWGAPKQDLWIYQHKQKLGVPVMIGVGGTFDFLSGRQKRAPLSWRKHGFEWLWRLLREPTRLKRQLALPQFYIRVWWVRCTGKDKRV